MKKTSIRADDLNFLNIEIIQWAEHKIAGECDDDDDAGRLETNAIHYISNR